MKVIIFLFFLLLIYWVSFRQAILFLIGIGYGIVLTHYRFGFTTGWRNFIEKRDSSGINGQILLIGLLSLLSLIAFKFFPQLSSAEANITISLIIGSFFFGLFMQLANGCGSGTLYKAGSLNYFSLLILIGFIGGSFLGTLNLTFWVSLGTIFEKYNFFRNTSSDQSIISIFVFVLGFLGILILVNKKSQKKFNFFNFSNFLLNLKNLFNLKNRWIKGGILLAFLAWLNLLVAGQPWGIVYGLGLWGAKFAHLLGWNPSGSAYWSLPYQQQALHSSILLDTTSITNLGLILGGLLISLKPNISNYKVKTNSTYLDNQPKWNSIISTKNIATIFYTLIIGVLLGYSSRLALGCNIGALVSGISTGSLHGWGWMIFAFSGSYLGIKIRKFLKIQWGRYFDHPY